MRRAVVLQWLLLLVLTDPAGAIIDKLDFPSFPSNITITNTTASSVTFVRVSQICASSSPDSFTVAGHTSTSIQVIQKYYDTGLDNCFAAGHDILYQDQGNPANSLRIIQRPGTNQQFCLSVKALFVSIGQCPEATGNVLGPANGEGSFTSVSCPPSIQNCPPWEGAENGTPNQNFGFVITDLPPFVVMLKNPSSNPLACSLVDLNNKTDRNDCVRLEVDANPGLTRFSLPAICPNKAYRLADRTNVQLLCYIDGTNANGQQTWVPTTHDATYTYAPSRTRPVILTKPSRPSPQRETKER